MILHQRNCYCNQIIKVLKVFWSSTFDMKLCNQSKVDIPSQSDCSIFSLFKVQYPFAGILGNILKECYISGMHVSWWKSPLIDFDQKSVLFVDLSCFHWQTNWRNANTENWPCGNLRPLKLEIILGLNDLFWYFASVYFSTFLLSYEQCTWPMYLVLMRKIVKHFHT